MTRESHDRTEPQPMNADGNNESVANSTVGPKSEPTPENPETPAFTPPGHPDEVGRLGKYRIQRLLGRGGMGAVYLAFDEHLERPVALKVMLPKAAANPAAKDRFLREARAAAKIPSDHVVSIYEASEINGVPYIALQLLKGYPLDEYLRNKGNPSILQAIRLIREAAIGLAAAHKLGLVHRDIKPANLWLEAPSGRVKILDFGLAKAIAGSEKATDLTSSGAVVGTANYMAPEQGMGSAVDARADLFSLGCTLYRLVTGRLPFDGPTLMAVLHAIVNVEPQPVQTLNPKVPDSLAVLIHRLLAKVPADRPASAKEVVKELDQIALAMKSKSKSGEPPVVMLAPMAVSVHQTSPFENLYDGETVAEKPDLRASANRNRTGNWPRIATAAGFAFVFLAMMFGVIVIKITNRDGTVTELKVPDDSKIEIDGMLLTPEMRKSESKPKPANSPVPVTARNESTAGFPNALVLSPAKLPGVKRWTVETKMPRAVLEQALPSPDGSILAGTSTAGVVHLLDPKTLLTVRVLYAPYTEAGKCQWSKDGKHLAVHMWNLKEDLTRVAAIVVFDMPGGRIQRTLPFKGQISSFAWSPDEKTFAVTFYDWNRPGQEPERLAIIDAVTGNEQVTYRGHRLAGLIWSPDGKRIYAQEVWTGRSRLYAFDPESERPIFSVSPPKGREIIALSRSPDGEHIVTLSQEGVATLIEAKTGEILVSNPIKIRPNQSCTPAWTPDGKFLCVQGEDLDFYNPKTLTKSHEISLGKSRQIAMSYLNWLPDGQTICFAGVNTAGTVSPDGTVRVALSAHWSLRSQLGAFVTKSGVAIGQRIYDPISGEFSPLFPKAEGKEQNINEFSSDLEYRLAVSEDKWVVSQRTTGAELFTFPRKDANAEWLASNLIAIRDKDRTILRSVPSGNVIGEIPGGKAYWNPSWCASNQRLFRVEEMNDGTKVVVWDMKSGKSILEVPVREEWPVVDDTGKRLVLNGYNRFRLCDAKTGKRLHYLYTNRGRVFSSAFSTDSKTVYIGEESGFIQRLDCDMGKPAGSPLRALGTAVVGLSWLVPDKILLVLESTGSLSAIDVTTGKRLGGLLREERYHIPPMIIGRDGHVRGEEGYEDNIFYVAELEDGTTQTFSPAEFSKRFGWKNDPAKARLEWTIKN